MSNRYFSVSPLPFENNGARTLFTEEHAPHNVVEPDSSGRAGVHPHVRSATERPRGFVAPTLFEVSGDHYDEHADDDVDLNNDHDGGDQAAESSEPVDDVGDDYATSRAELLRRDHDDRAANQRRTQRERDERRVLRRTRTRLRGRRRPAARARQLDVQRQRVDEPVTSVWSADESGLSTSRGRRHPKLSISNLLHVEQGVAHVATHSSHLKGVVAPLQGTAMALYFVLLPYVVLSKWGGAARNVHGTLLRVLLVVLALFWLIFLIQVVVHIARLRRGTSGGQGGSAWLAGLLVAVLPFLLPAAVIATHAPHSISQPVRTLVERSTVQPRGQHRTGPASPAHPGTPLSLSALGSLPMALMAKRRSDLIRQHQFVEIDHDVDESIRVLRGLNPTLLAQLRQLIGDQIEGVIEVPHELPASSTVTSDDPLVVCSLGATDATTLVSFAREGGHLAILPTWNGDDVTNAVVALHEGRLVFTRSEQELLRALATRTVRNTMVLYLGPPRDLDDELAACAITLTPYLGTAPPVTQSWSRPNDAERIRTGDVRVDLLRADPQVFGLCEALTPTLRRRGIEMLAYLALHRNEPVTGDRLRTRVLTHADVDASIRTLANTASVVRRSAGADASGPRLHAVTSSGLYITHGITSDVEIFTTLIAHARQLANDEAAPLAHQALAMVKGEPLASALRGFEWFLAEGYGARLSRDGEWAALALHHDAVSHGRYELAFWALQQGLLIDPYSDVLLEASARVPRLREFGGDGRGLAQDETIGPGRAEAMSWSFNGLSNQVTE
jgi:hypothetical protein